MKVEGIVADLESLLPGEARQGLKSYFHDQYQRTEA